jgi:hypothetical protein
VKEKIARASILSFQADGNVGSRPLGGRRSGRSDLWRSFACSVTESADGMDILSTHRMVLDRRSSIILAAFSDTASNGKPGHHEYDAGSTTLSLNPGATPARYRRGSSAIFRPARDDGQLGGFTCPLNLPKNANRPPWYVSPGWVNTTTAPGRLK